MKLTGTQRAILVLKWIKRGKDMPKETFIKKVCEAKGIEYTQPPVIDRSISTNASMFPVKK